MVIQLAVLTSKQIAVLVYFQELNQLYAVCDVTILWGDIQNFGFTDSIPVMYWIYQFAAH